MGLLGWVLIGISYVGLVFLHWGLYFAYWQGQFYSQEYRKSDLRVSFFTALIPIMWFVTPILTGGYPHGWKLYWRVK
jgi:hypothetical protein